MTQRRVPHISGKSVPYQIERVMPAGENVDQGDDARGHFEIRSVAGHQSEAGQDGDGEKRPQPDESGQR